MMTVESLGEHHYEFGVFPLPSKNFMILTLGMTKESNCFPVQRGFGFRIAGEGSAYSFELPNHIIRFITVYLSTKFSLLVKSIMPNKES
jgi:hypothetical protein